MEFVKVVKFIILPVIKAMAWLLIVILAASILPLSGGIEAVLKTADHWISGHLTILILLAILLVCLPATRGTLRNLLVFDDPGTYISLVLISVGTLSIVGYAGSYDVPNRPLVFFYIAIGFTIAAVIALWLRLGMSPYVPRQGVLAPDKEMEARSQLAHEQGVVLDNLKELLLRQQQIRSIGLFGDWGTGKTSVYAIAKHEIQKEDPSIIWVEIEPWRYTSQESLVLGFYDEIGKGLERAIPGVQNSASELLKIADTLVRTNDHTGIFTAVVEWLARAAKRKTDDPAEYIHQLLKREGKYLIVAVDNVERTAEDAQVMRTLQLVHFLRSDNVAYVFISEKDRLLAALSMTDQGKKLNI